MDVAVVGSGISGIVASYLMDGKYNVTLYESRERLGGHSHTVQVNQESVSQPVDTGFIVFNDRNYPNFRIFLDELDVPTEPTEMSFSFRDARSGLEYGTDSLRAFFAQSKNLIRWSHWMMLYDILRFNLTAPKDTSQRSNNGTLRQYLDQKNFSDTFINNHLIPMVSAIWSVSMETAMNFPFHYVIEFFENHGLLSLWNRPQWRTITGGSREYIRSFRDQFKGTVRTGDPVEEVQRIDDGVQLRSSRSEQKYDSVVLATHSDQALEILRKPDDREREILGDIEYKQNQVLLHTDQSLLPEDPTIWASWNYHRGGGSGSDPTVTYNLNILQHLDFELPVCVSLNSGDAVSKDQILDEFTYAHPIFNEAALNAQDRKDEICGRGNLYYTGAYWGNGFHEDGVRSAIDVADKLGVSWPL